MSSTPITTRGLNQGFPSMIDGDTRKWEDLQPDEKVEKLMAVVTILYNRVQKLEEENGDMKRHHHNSTGFPVVEKMIGEQDFPSDLGGLTKTRNPFNVGNP